jgi:hypothetical protein
MVEEKGGEKRGEREERRERRWGKEEEKMRIVW